MTKRYCECAYNGIEEVCKDCKRYELVKEKQMKEVKVTRDSNGEVRKISHGFEKSMDCYLVEIIKNDLPRDTEWRLEMADNDYLDIGIDELIILRDLLNSEEFKSIIG